MKVVGNHSCVRGGFSKSVHGHFEKNWGKKPRVAPDSSDLSPHWLNMNEDYKVSTAKVGIFIELYIWVDWRNW